MILIANDLVKFMRKIVMELVIELVMKLSQGLIMELRRRQLSKEGTNDGVDETMVKAKERKTDGTRKRGQYTDDTLLIRHLLKEWRQ